ERGWSKGGQHAFGPGKKAGEIKAGLVLVRSAADSNHRAISENDLETENIIAGDPIFEAARAAGVGGDIAANERISAAGRIRWIEQPALLDRRLQPPRNDAWLDDSDEIGGID